MLINVVSCPPCRLALELKTQAGLSDQGTGEPKAAGGVDKVLEWRCHIAKAGGAAQRKA